MTAEAGTQFRPTRCGLPTKTLSPRSIRRTPTWTPLLISATQSILITTAAAAQPRRRAARVQRRTAGSPALEWQVIGGRRSHYEARAELPGAVALGLKSRDGTRLGFVTYRGRGVVRAVHVGNLALHMGERLVLGRRGGRFPPTVWTPVRGGVRVAPSLSSWFGQNGLAVTTGWRGWETRSIAVTRHEAAFSGAALWLALHRSTSSHSLGVAWGRQLGKVLARDREGASTVISVHGSLRRGTLAGSAELVGFVKGRSFLAARVTQRGTTRWSLFVYNAPTFSSGTNPALDFLPGHSVRRGARLDLRGRLASRTMIFYLWVGSSGSPDARRRFRRAVVELSGRQRSLSWRGGVDWVLQRYDGFAGRVFPEPFDRREHTGRVKVAVRLDYAWTTHDLRIHYLPPVSGRGGGVMTTAAGSVESGRVHASWRISAYSLAPGQLSFIARPGVGGFEAFSTVSGQGSDLSTRVRVRLGPNLLLFFYYGVPHLQERRIYAGMRMRL